MFPKPSQFLADAEYDNAANAVVTLARVLNERSTLDTSTVRSWFGQYLDLWPESVRA